MRELSLSPSIGSRGPDSGPRPFRSPGVLSEAMRHLALASNDRDVAPIESTRTEDANSILRIMSDLFSFSLPKGRKFSDQSRQREDAPNNFSLQTTTRSTVLIKDTSSYLGIDVAAAAEYKYTLTNPLDWCKVNGEIAKRHDRVDHERIFSMLQVILVNVYKPPVHHDSMIGRPYSSLMVQLVEKL